ncbi:MAG: type II toxin-antitoxin system RelB/DinJ family antitoxin [Defluviitaleaceae bacterium]|nr:type II toxin-antitoxin system RelB/DinJ family antitoxin [Defluviitaleaceae bacterium]
MPKTSTIHTRIEPEIKEQVDTILDGLGISTTEAINMFFRQIIRYRGIPLDLRVPNDETIAAIKEAEQGLNLHKCDSLDQLLRELKED